MIHPTAIIESGAQIADGVSIGAYSVIGADVSIGKGTVVGPHVVINGHTAVGENNQIFQFASVGEVSQDKKPSEKETSVEIGDNNVIRECVTIHRGTAHGSGVTKIGNDNLFMAYSHIAHDCQIGSHNVFVNSTNIAGHVLVDSHVIMSAFTAIHQFCHVGSHSFIAHGTMCSKDIPPYLMVTGGMAPTTKGINSEGLKRRGFSAEDIENLRRAYKIIYRQGLLTKEAIPKLQELAQTSKPVQLFADFLASSERGIVR